ncbi:MAG TPA: glycoside hydrolase family 9 protein [Bryobacteraceae bacterium]
MNRRHFLTSLGIAAPAALSLARLRAQEGPPLVEPILDMTPRAPVVAMCHLGFLPRGSKTVIVHAGTGPQPAQFTLRDIGSGTRPFDLTRPLKQGSSELGDCLVGDFSDIDREAMYQVTAGSLRSVPFFIRADLWRRTLPAAAGYIHAQRCGVAVPNVHPVCHLDDARRRDTGQHVDVTGGWHDAGDLRKWMSATMHNGFALLELARSLGREWDRAGTGLEPLHDEFRWGNRYFLKMQDADGLVWDDTAGGVNGDNSDNHWTDNITGTADDRYINPAKTGLVQAMFVALQATAAQVFRQTDAAYAGQCSEAALRCWKAAERGSSAGELAWWVRAAVELHRATGSPEWADRAAALGTQLLALQNVAFTGSQKIVRGFWRMDRDDTAPYHDAVASAMPPLALLDLAAAFPQHSDAKRWRDAIKLHLEEYVLPMSARSPYRIVPFSLFKGSPTKEHYRPLAGELTYRYFMPVMKEFWWVGNSSHVGGYAVLGARAAKLLGQPAYRDLAFRQLEWILGANPFGASLMTGEGIRQPYPHSRYVGLIHGGIMNGIGGNQRDEPVLDTEMGLDWRTAEYWSPHNAHYIAAVAALESA